MSANDNDSSSNMNDNTNKNNNLESNMNDNTNKNNNLESNMNDNNLALDMISNMTSNDDNLASDMISSNNDNFASDMNNDTDDNTNKSDNNTDIKKVDKRKRESYEPSEWKLIQEKRLTAFRKKQSEKKQKLESYDEMKTKVELLEKILIKHEISLPSTDPVFVTEEACVNNELSESSVEHSFASE
jgi:hypothetical protein